MLNMLGELTRNIHDAAPNEFCHIIDDHGSLKHAYNDFSGWVDWLVALFPIDLVSVYITYFRQPIDTSGRLMASEVVRERALTMYL